MLVHILYQSARNKRSADSQAYPIYTACMMCSKLRTSSLSMLSTVASDAAAADSDCDYVGINTDRKTNNQ